MFSYQETMAKITLFIIFLSPALFPFVNRKFPLTHAQAHTHTHRDTPTSYTFSSFGMSQLFTSRIKDVYKIYAHMHTRDSSQHMINFESKTHTHMYTPMWNMEPPCIHACTRTHIWLIFAKQQTKNAHIYNFMIVKTFELIINNDRSNAINILKAIFCSLGQRKSCSHNNICERIHTHAHPTLRAVIFVALSLYQISWIAWPDSCLQKVQEASSHCQRFLLFAPKEKKRFRTINLHTHTQTIQHRCVNAKLSQIDISQLISTVSANFAINSRAAKLKEIPFTLGCAYM